MESDLVFFNQIQDFLIDPINKTYAAAYENTIMELRNKITARRDEFGKFDEVLTYLYDHIFQSHKKDLNDQRKLIFTFLHYMYWNCDIGDK